MYHSAFNIVSETELFVIADSLLSMAYAVTFGIPVSALLVFKQYSTIKLL